MRGPQVRTCLIAIVFGLVGMSCGAENVDTNWTDWTHTEAGLNRMRGIKNAESLGARAVLASAQPYGGSESAIAPAISYFGTTPDFPIAARNATCFIRELAKGKRFSPPFSVESAGIHLLNRTVLLISSFEMTPAAKDAFGALASDPSLNVGRFLSNGEIQYPRFGRLLADGSGNATSRDLEDFDRYLQKAFDTVPANSEYTVAKQMISIAAEGSCANSVRQYEADMISSHALSVYLRSGSNKRIVDKELKVQMQLAKQIGDDDAYLRHKKYFRNGTFEIPVSGSTLADGQVASPAEISTFGQLIIGAILTSKDPSLLSLQRDMVLFKADAT